MKKYEIISSETVCEGRFLRFLTLTYRDPEEVLRKWEAVERVNCEGVVAIVPVTDEGEMILIRQFRPPVNAHVIEFPAGLIDRKETAEEAASRELLEETGYAAKEMSFLARGPLSSGASREVLTAFLARRLEFKGIGRRDETEDLEVLKMPVDAAEETLSRFENEGNLIDLKIFGLIEMAKRRLSRQR